MENLEPLTKLCSGCSKYDVCFVHINHLAEKINELISHAEDECPHFIHAAVTCEYHSKGNIILRKDIRPEYLNREIKKEN